MGILSLRIFLILIVVSFTAVTVKFAAHVFSSFETNIKQLNEKIINENY